MKSKIEEKIEKAREATNEMFAAFDELNESLSEKPTKWSPKDGEYYAAKKSGSLIWIGIKRGKDIYFDGQDIPDYCHICSGEEGTLNIYNSELVFVKSVRPATPSEIALLDSKLAEQGKRFDKEKLELVDIPKHKEPIIGEMAIFWNFNKCNAHIRIFTDKREGRYIEHIGCSWNNAILYESPEQYKAFLKS